jgi:cytochrome c
MLFLLFIPSHTTNLIKLRYQMNLLKTVVIVASAAGLSLGATIAAADGAALYAAKGCVGCHGAEGKAPIMPVYPKLAGQNAAYCEKQIADIKAGTRGNSPLMVGMVAGLTEAETAEICTYLAEE